jgi:Protein of unknown function (DUF1501)
MPPRHNHGHAFEMLRPHVREGVGVSSRRNFLKASLAGLGALSVSALLQQRALATERGKSISSRKSVILLWMSGGPSQIDTWDPKPNRPLQNRGPFGVIRTKLPGVFVCEHLPKQAAMLDKFTIIRSVNADKSNHEPNTVFQTGNVEAAPRVNPIGHLYPAIGSIVAKHHGANQPGMPPYVSFHRSRNHVAFAGYLGMEYDPFPGNLACNLPIYDNVGKDTGRVSKANLFQAVKGMTSTEMTQRLTLSQQLDHLRREIDSSGAMAAMDRYQQQAVELVLGGKARAAFNLNEEPAENRERYGKHLWCQQALMARRLVQAGVAFVTIDLNYHPASGTWDTHGDNIPPYGGISKGLKPLLPLFDHLITTLVNDLQEHDLLDDVLVIAMGEFGRTPQMGTQDSTDGRNHWPNIMSMCLAGGGLRHGQVIGESEKDGGAIKSNPVTPSDLAATIYRHMGVPLDATYLDPTGRPRAIVDTGKPIQELF